MNKLLIVLIFSLVFIFSTSSVEGKKKKTTEGLVNAPAGPIKGLVKDTFNVYYGIPFAHPPVGDFRFHNPVPLDSWSDVYNANSQKPMCPQNCTLGPAACSKIGTDEDCLYLDIFTPHGLTEDSLVPVMIYITGGAYTMGTGACDLYHAAKFANSSIIVVNINYRLGVLGFLANDYLDGNYGFFDQQLSIKWVVDNIQAFGGDPNQISLAGESAGGFSVAVHLTSPSSSGLFQRAIMQSSPLTVGVKTKSKATGFSNRFAKSAGCASEDLVCLRGLSMVEVLEAQASVSLQLFDAILDAFTIWTPVIDDQNVRQPLTVIKEGTYDDIPIIVGDVRDEARLFVHAFYKEPLGKTVYSGALVAVFGLMNAITVGQMYPCEGDCRDALSAMLTDYLFHCSGRYLVNKHIGKNTPLYHYMFTHINSRQPGGFADHGNELEWEFNTYSYIGHESTAAERTMAEYFNNFWVNFMTNSNPNDVLPIPDGVEWNPITATDKHTLIINTHYETKDIVTSSPKCDMFDSIGYRGFT